MTASQKPGRTTVIMLIIAVMILLVAGWMGFAASAPSTIKIGLVAPFEGVCRNTGYEVLFAVKAAVQERNQGKGVGGYRVELVALNDFNDPDEARRQAQSMVADPGIVGVIGHLSPESTAAALPVYQEAKLAVVSPWSVDVDIFNGEHPGFVSVAATNTETSAHLQNIIREMNLEPAAIVSTEADIANIPAGSRAVQLTTDAVTAGEILLKMEESGITLPQFGNVATGNRQLIQVGGSAADGLIFVSPGPDAADNPAARQFAEAYQAMAGLPPGPRAVLAYDATHVLLDAVEETMNLNKNWYNNQLNRGDVSQVIIGIRQRGISGDIAFGQQGQRLDPPIWAYQISSSNYPGTLIEP